MKRIRCPKCDEPIVFDDSRYQAGSSLVFECPECHKQFRLRIGQRANPPAMVDTDDSHESEEREVAGWLIVIENAFHFRQEIPLYEGANTIGRFVRGTKTSSPIKTVDPSVDTTHCRIFCEERNRRKIYICVERWPVGHRNFPYERTVGRTRQGEH